MAKELKLEPTKKLPRAMAMKARWKRKEFPGADGRESTAKVLLQVFMKGSAQGVHEIHGIA